MGNMPDGLRLLRKFFWTTTKCYCENGYWCDKKDALNLW